MSQGLFTAVTGIRSNQTRLTVIANNLSNVNTTAFKSSAVNFETVFADTIRGGTAPNVNTGGTNPMQIGNGVAVSDIPVDFSQGGSQFTGRNTDLIIQGEGFFTIEKVDRNGVPGFYLTRAGNFNMDSSGNLVTATGNRVQGTRTIDGNDETLVMPINMPFEIRVFKEIDSTTADVIQTWIGEPGSTTITAADMSNPANNFVVRDVELTNFSFGTDGALTLTYSNGDRITVQTENAGFFREVLHVTAEGSTFSEDGLDSTGTLTVVDSNPADSSKNYIAPEQLQLRLASVPNPAGLIHEGGNNWNLSPNSGPASFGIANNNSRGAVQGGALESSNVDVAKEFTNMIISQRGLEAASKAVTVQSDVLRTIIGII